MAETAEGTIIPTNEPKNPYDLIRSGEKPLDYGGIYDVQNYDKQRDDAALQQYDPTKDFEYKMIVDRYQPRRKYTPEQEERKKMFASFGDASVGLGELLASVTGGGRNVIRDRRAETTHAEKTGAEIDAARDKYEKELLNYNNLLHSAGMRGRDKAEKDLAGQRGLKMELLLKELEGKKADEREKARLAAQERAQRQQAARFWASLGAKGNKDDKKTKTKFSTNYNENNKTSQGIIEKDQFGNLLRNYEIPIEQQISIISKARNNKNWLESRGLIDAEKNISDAKIETSIKLASMEQIVSAYAQDLEDGINPFETIEETNGQKEYRELLQKLNPKEYEYYDWDKDDKYNNLRILKPNGTATASNTNNSNKIPVWDK
ncbi:MAG: hypothetical protein LBN27_05130 [Prevotellaceae bacterium]|jgi:hypothetical protein|nr:hypothetical protein [Prevotellaceae bacterium]